MTDEAFPERVYAVRASEDFAAQSEAAYDWLAEKADLKTADSWRAGLQEVKATLATLPERFFVAEENRIYRKKYPDALLRVSLYRHGRTTWRLLLTVHEATADDPAHVMIHQLRHGAQKPLKKWPDER